MSTIQRYLQRLVIETFKSMFAPIMTVMPVTAGCLVETVPLVATSYISQTYTLNELRHETRCRDTTDKG